MKSSHDLPAFLYGSDLQILLFGGKGGVGKTSCATAAALKRAQALPDTHLLLISTDPAHSLSDCIAGDDYPSNLEIIELNARQSLSAFMDSHKEKLRQIALRGTFLDDEDIGRFLDLSVPGMDELMALLEITRWVERRTYDCIIVDTAPTGHTLRLLAMPELLRKWLEALDVLLAKHRYMTHVFKGSYQRDEVDAFVLGQTDALTQMINVLQNPARCCFIPVMLAEKLSIRETADLLAELERRAIPVQDIVVNRLLGENSCPVCETGRSLQKQELDELPEIYSHYGLWGIPLYAEETRGADALEVFWEGTFPLVTPHRRSAMTQPSANIRRSLSKPMVEEPAALPFPETTLLLFAGKGGVGKTTLACTTALRLAGSFTGKNVFLFSTDPAHSLSACFDTGIGPEPVVLVPGLTAMEIDAQAEFRTLKKRYAKELEHFLETLAPNLDLTFDLEVMERVLDLSPPGLDEVMALTRAMDFLGHGIYDISILDTAPTGHLIRFLETPEVIGQWLQAFFNIFLKYKTVFRLPKIAQQLVQMSKDLKFLRTLLRDPERSSLFAVTILTEMAFEETSDLVDACDRMEVNVAGLFLNRVTQENKCALCSALNRRESRIKKKFRQAFAGTPQTIVYNMGDLRGIQQLGKLGQVLYRPV